MKFTIKKKIGNYTQFRLFAESKFDSLLLRWYAIFLES